MLLLRMLAFRPHDADYAPPLALPTEAKTNPPALADKPAIPQAAEPPRMEAPPALPEQPTTTEQRTGMASYDQRADDDEPPSLPQSSNPPTENSAQLAERWQELLPQLGLSGMTASIASHCTLAAAEGDNWLLHLDPSQSLLSETQQQRLSEALEKFHGRHIHLRIERQTPAEQTPAQRSAQQKQIRLQQAEQAIQQEPLVQAMMEQFAAVIEPGSVQPID